MEENIVDSYVSKHEFYVDSHHYNELVVNYMKFGYLLRLEY